MTTRRFFMILTPLVSLLLVGCGETINTTSVSGTVTFRNDPVKSGRLKFYNSKGEQVSGAVVKADGTYIATDLPKAEIRVVLESGDGMNMKGMAQTKLPPGVTTVAGSDPVSKGISFPAKYLKVETTDLKFTVTNESNQKYDIKIQ